MSTASVVKQDPNTHKGFKRTLILRGQDKIGAHFRSKPGGFPTKELTGTYHRLPVGPLLGKKTIHLGNLHLLFCNPFQINVLFNVLFSFSC